MSAAPVADRASDRAILAARACGGRGCECARSLARGRGNTHCPGPSHANGDRSPSLTVAAGDGVVLVNCKAGCSQDAVIAELQRQDLWPRAAESAPAAPRRRRWEIRDVGGALQAFHDRTDLGPKSKRLAWRLPDGTSGLGGRAVATLPLYGSEDLPAVADGAVVVVVEGEPARDALAARGVAAVATVTGAAATPAPEVMRPLERFDVVLWPDNDSDGAAHMRRIGAVLVGLGVRPRLVAWPEVPSKGDAADFLDSDEALAALLGAARPFDDEPTVSVPTEVGTVEARERAEAPWPDELAERAYYGPIGQLVAEIAPHTEASAAALIAHLLSAIGCYIGKDVRALAGDASHPARINALVVGPTATGRKGTARSVTERVLATADEQFARDNTTEGASSGEGLIWEVRDPIYRNEKVGKGKDASYEEVCVDPGVDDKRRWIVESEFASVLRVAQREGNTLSAIIRRAWDRDDIRALTKNSPARATGAHISLVGHISRDELFRYLDRTELANGMINRFLLVASRRSRLLPDGETVPPSAIWPLARHLLDVRAWAGERRLIRRDDAARDVWHAVYGDLTRDRPGIFGAATSRAEAQVLRLSVLYAAVDCSELIRAEHLLAALAIWRYAEQSARWVFGDAVGDPTADTILAALRRAGGLDRTDLAALFGRNIAAARIDAALGILVRLGLAASRREPTGGRPREVWYAI